MRSTPDRRLLRGIRAIALGALAAIPVACDHTPAELEAPIREQSLRQLEQSASRTGPGSAEQLVLDAAARLGAGPAQPAPALPGLDHLYELALERVAERRGPAAASGVSAEHRAMQDAAWEAIARGDQDTGERELAAARDQRARLTVMELGNGFAVAYVAVVGMAVERAHGEIAPSAGRRVDGRLRRMAGSARNLHSDAGRALLSGEAAAALDVASHAAGLLNTFFDEIRRTR